MKRRSGSPVDVVAWGLFLSGLVVAFCVFGHDPAEGAAVAYPPPSRSWDVELARLLHDTLGVAVYALLACWFTLVLFLFLRRHWKTWGFRLMGWLLLVPGTTVVADWAGPEQLGGPVAGSGGTLGAWLRILLKDNYPLPAAAVILGGTLSLGLLLAFDFLFGPVFRGLGKCLRWLAGVWRRPGTERTLTTIRTESFPDAEAGEASEEEQPEVVDDGSIPIHRPTAPALPPSAPRIIPIVRPGPADGDAGQFADYELPPLTLLEDPKPFPYAEQDQSLRERATILEKTFTDFGLNVKVVGINTGPVITQYEISLETGLRVHKVTNLADDIALNLKVPSVRIVAPIPGKNTVGIEIPNEHRAVVQLKEVILSSAQKVAKHKIPLFLGKDTEGRPLVYDLAEMPHLLIAGRTGTGKSVCMNSIILSMLMTRRPDELKMIMIDPKMLELSEYGKIPHLMHPIVKDMKKAEAILSWAVDKMEERYDLLSRARVRSIAGYNELSLEEIHRRVKPEEEEKSRIPARMPYIVIFVDEMGDLMMTMKKEVEGHIIRLAQKSRAAGIHLVVATQKPTVDVITGLIKSNLPARICFQVSSRSDSRVVLDEMGADKLLGKGDMLFLQPGTSTILRSQGTYAGDAEITRVVEHMECDPCYATELVQLGSAEAGKGGFLDALRARDEVYIPAIDVVVREGRGSVSLLQRALGIGYGRAARLVDFMAEDGIVGSYNGSHAREVLYNVEQWEQIKKGGKPEPAAAV